MPPLAGNVCGAMASDARARLLGEEMELSLRCLPEYEQDGSVAGEAAPSEGSLPTLEPITQPGGLGYSALSRMQCGWVAAHSLAEAAEKPRGQQGRPWQKSHLA